MPQSTAKRPNHPRAIRLPGGLLLVSLAALLTLRCDFSLLASPKPTRTVHVRVVADPDFAGHALWRTNVENLFQNASAFYTSWFGIAFEVDTTLVWDIEESPWHGKMLEHDCLVRDVPRGKSDVVVYFTKEANWTKLHYLGISLFTEGYVRVIQANWANVEGGYIKAFHTLVHELGHLFGAMHLYDDGKKETVYVMDRMVTDDVMEKRGMALAYVEPAFHPGNAAIVAALAQRRFDGGPWPANSARRILDVYRRMRAEHCPWQVDKDGGLASNELDQYNEDDWYFFVANWLSLCGQDSLALVYCDSLAVMANAIRQTCLREPGTCKSRLCLRVGCRGESIEQWYQWHRINQDWTRAMLLLRARRGMEADSVMRAFYQMFPEERAATKNEYQGSYQYYRQRYLALAQE